MFGESVLGELLMKYMTRLRKLDLVMVNKLVYFRKPLGYVVGSLILHFWSHLVSRKIENLHPLKVIKNTSRLKLQRHAWESCMSKCIAFGRILCPKQFTFISFNTPEG